MIIISDASNIMNSRRYTKQHDLNVIRRVQVFGFVFIGIQGRYYNMLHCHIMDLKGQFKVIKKYNFR